MSRKHWMLVGCLFVVLVVVITLITTRTRTPQVTGGSTSSQKVKLTTNAPIYSGMDATGRTAPITNYPIPVGAVFMSLSGNDGNKGSQSQPVRSLKRALALVPNGGTVVVRGGVYRDGVSSSQTKKFTLQPYPREQVWFDGTDQIRSMTRVANDNWYVDWNTPSFCAGKYYERSYLSQRPDNTGPCTHIDMANDPKYKAAGDPQMVFVDGKYLPEYTTLAEARGKGFFYDQSAKRLHIGIDPRGHTIELAARPTALRIEGGPGGQTIRGIGFRRFASNEYSGNATHGAVFAGTPNVTIERTVFTENAGAGLFFSSGPNRVVKHSVFTRNGFNGFDANGTHIGKGRDNLVIDTNIFESNNTEHFGTNCNKSCAAAGVKLAHMVDFTLKNNFFQNNIGTGFWCDLACSDGKMVKNIFRKNTNSGLYYEVSQRGIIASNLSFGNGNYGIKNGSGTTKIYNNTVIGNRTNILVYDDSRPASGSEISPETRKVEMANNIFSGSRDTAFMTYKGQTSADQYFSLLNYNSYHRAATTSPRALIEWHASSKTNVFTSLSAFRDATGYEKNGSEFSGSDPFFENPAIEDFRLRARSTARLSGKPLPVDVATLIGARSGVAVDRGALTWPGR